MNVIKNVELKPGLKRPDVKLRRLAKDKNVYAIFYHERMDITDGEGKVIGHLKPGYSVTMLKEFITGRSRKDLEALYQNIVHSMCNIWVAKFTDI